MKQSWFSFLLLNLQTQMTFTVNTILRETVESTFQFVVFGVCMKQDVREEHLKAVASVPRPILHVGPHRLVELH